MTAESEPQTTRAEDRQLRTSVLAGVAGFLVLAVAGLLVGLLRPPTYRSTAVLTLDDPNITSAADPSGISKVALLRNLYAPLLTTRDVVDPIAEHTGLTPTQVSERVKAIVAKDSLLILVTATGPTRSGSQRLAAASADELVAYTADLQTRADVPSDRAVSMKVLSPAGGAVKVTARLRTVLTLAGLLGGLGAVAGVVLAGRRAVD